MAPLASFCALIAEDARITPTHISLYVALLNAWEIGGCVNPLLITRGVIMRAAKISARQTYNRAMNELNEYGYIKYLPSADPRVNSRVWMGEQLKKDKENESAS